MKFKLKEGKDSVRVFTLKDKDYFPGDIVELPQTYEGEKWLIRVDPVPVVTPPPQKITPASTVTEPAIVTEKPLAQTVEKTTQPDWGTSKKKTATA